MLFLETLTFNPRSGHFTVPVVQSGRYYPEGFSTRKLSLVQQAAAHFVRCKSDDKLGMRWQTSGSNRHFSHPDKRYVVLNGIRKPAINPVLQPMPRIPHSSLIAFGVKANASTMLSVPKSEESSIVQTITFPESTIPSLLSLFNISPHIVTSTSAFEMGWLIFHTLGAAKISEYAPDEDLFDKVNTPYFYDEYLCYQNHLFAQDLEIACFTRDVLDTESGKRERELTFINFALPELSLVGAGRHLFHALANKHFSVFYGLAAYINGVKFTARPC